MIAKRIAALRTAMKNKNLDAYIIPSADPHQSEYVSDHWKLRTYFSGFTGSAGTLIITKDIAGVWTDSRYFLQFEEECKDTEVVLYKQSIPHAPEHVAWLCNLLHKNAVIGIDYRQFSKAQVDYLTGFTSLKNIQLQNETHLVDGIWNDRPSLPNTPIQEHATVFSGLTVAFKLNKVYEVLREKHADFYFFSALDEIAWLLNIRANDVDFTPLVTAYLLVGEARTIVFADKSRFSANLLAVLSACKVVVEDYESITEIVPLVTKNKKIVTDSASLNYAMYHAIAGEFVFEKSIAKELKAVKNSVEIEGAKECMLKDGVALTKFFIWLEKELEENAISEYEIGKKLEEFRREQAHYVGASFASIVGYKGNGAIIHYTAPKEGSAMVQKEGVLLIDSGAQYKNGTTDITRTIWLGGTPTETIKKAYTSVLKGYIELERLQFPLGTTGAQIDAFARVHLWKNGLDYPHGTGHGIGSFGMVHEPAQGFTTGATTERGTTVHKPNQFTTIEPGCYVANEFGIRTENVVLSKTVRKTAFGEFIGFEPLTWCYIDTSLVLITELSSAEITWLNAYHALVFKQLSPFLNKEETNWLQEKCKAV
ncbi:Peptidase, M24 family (Xaa-Pro aminopeptidase) [Tenacibaculum maritimum]|uniref:aminopeptidase P family protein n=1 Tax=Tenacibaculum maritimum TaxID=107401 RepID=UPI0012E43878|nr:aminopeptidase P family protein [Tenacibaculum maritimum]CAA0163883.1 Peptidase, M24 family (Xaa-Pro aminopeptidase) [Tenacibaculum maritimum]